MSMEKSFQLRNKLDKNNEAQLEADLLNNSVGPSMEGSTASGMGSKSDVDSFLHNSSTLHQILHALNPKGTAGQDNALGDSERDINSSVTDTPRQKDIVDLKEALYRLRSELVGVVSNGLGDRFLWNH